jgi:hypothetical protein
VAPGLAGIDQHKRAEGKKPPCHHTKTSAT